MEKRAISQQQVLLKTGTRNFQNSPLFERSACFYGQSVEILKVFNILTLKSIFWKTKTFFKILEHNFSVENRKIENASFPYRTAISEANVKTNGDYKTDLSQRTGFCQ